jgi:hypothetical protein
MPYYQLSVHNAASYLAEQGLYPQLRQEDCEVKKMSAKNHNILLTLPEEKGQIFIKQERVRKVLETSELFQEWRFHSMVSQFPELEFIKDFIPDVAHFDDVNFVVVHNFFRDYRDLMDFYAKERDFSTEISSAIGRSLGSIHKATFNRSDCQAFLETDNPAQQKNQILDFVSSLENIGPEIFGSVPDDGIKFFVLYQRFDSLRSAILDLCSSQNSCCLNHNDLKLNNVILNNSWQKSDQQKIRLLDWERVAWGDPANDLGALVSSYLQLWLNSIVISKNLSIEESLDLATIPLADLQPSIWSLVNSYLQVFPEIQEHDNDFVNKSVRFAGLSMIQQIQAMIQYQKTFGNVGIGMLQVAKSLLCSPAKMMKIVFGQDSTDALKIA